MKIRETFRLIGTDIERYAEFNGLRLSLLKKISIFLMPCILCVAFQRLSYYCFLRNWHLVSRFFWTLNIVLFAADITPYTQIGSHFYMPHPTGIGLMAKIGNRCTVYVQVGIAGRKNKDIGAGKGAPILGDDVVVGAFAKIIGPIRIGNNVSIGPGSLVTKGAPDNVILYGVPAKIVRHKKTGAGASSATEEPA